MSALIGRICSAQGKRNRLRSTTDVMRLDFGGWCKDNFGFGSMVDLVEEMYGIYVEKMAAQYPRKGLQMDKKII